MISYGFKDNTQRIISSYNWRLSGACAEALAIKEAIKTTILLRISKVIVESDSQISISSILGRTQAPKQIRNLIEDIKYLGNDLREIDCLYCNRIVNRPTDSPVKRLISVVSQIFSINKFRQVFLQKRKIKREEA